MPEQAALSELKLSSTFKCCQRALAQWLEQQPGASMSVMAARRNLALLSQSEWTRLMGWLDLLLGASRHNRDMAMSARIERLAASLGRRIPPGPVALAPAGAVTLIGTAISRRAARTAGPAGDFPAFVPRHGDRIMCDATPGGMSGGSILLVAQAAKPRHRPHERGATR